MDCRKERLGRARTGDGGNLYVLWQGVTGRSQCVAGDCGAVRVSSTVQPDGSGPDRLIYDVLGPTVRDASVEAVGTSWWPPERPRRQSSLTHNRRVVVPKPHGQLGRRQVTTAMAGVAPAG